MEINKEREAQTEMSMEFLLAKVTKGWMPIY